MNLCFLMEMTAPQKLPFRVSQLSKETNPYIKIIYDWLLIDIIQQDMGTVAKHPRFSRY